MTDFGDILDHSLRLTLLRLLAEAPGYRSNTAVLHTAARSLGFHVSRDKITGQVDWLQEQSLVKCEQIIGVTVAEITQRGLDVANGLATVTGVARPSPKG